MDSCGLPFSISNLAETGLPFFLLVAKPCSSVTLALATTGASSAFSLSLMAAPTGIAQMATVRAANKAVGILGILTSLVFALLHSPKLAPSPGWCPDPAPGHKPLFNFRAGVGVDLQPYRDLKDERRFPLLGHLPRFGS